MKSSSRIENILSRVKKPSEAEAAALAKCFPSTSGPRKQFDPAEESVVKQNQNKKKWGIKSSKPSKVEVVMFEEFQDVPKGEARKKLKRKGRICDVQLTRAMSALQVENRIKKAFKHIPVMSFVVLETDSTGHFLNHSTTHYIYS